MVDAAGCRVIDKEHRGVRICLRLGPLSQEDEDAEYRLDAEIIRVESQLELRWQRARPPDGQRNEIDSGKRYA
jgi:hypothetical protein